MVVQNGKWCYLTANGVTFYTLCVTVQSVCFGVCICCDDASFVITLCHLPFCTTILKTTVCVYIRVYFVCIALAIHAILILGIYLFIHCIWCVYVQLCSYVRMCVCIQIHIYIMCFIYVRIIMECYVLGLCVGNCLSVVQEMVN